MSKITGNEPAMPVDLNDEGILVISPGLTIRQHFAAMAMQGCIASRVDYDNKEDVVKISVAMADALIAELNKEK